MSKILEFPTSGIRNILLNKQFNDIKERFTMIFGKHQIQMHMILADIFSNKVSGKHRTDATLNSYCFTTVEGICDDKIIDIITHLSRFESVEIDKDSAYNLRIISILIDNENLYSNLSKLYPLCNNQDIIVNLNQYCKYLADLAKYGCLNNKFSEYDINISQISQNFFRINQDTLLALPESILLQIITDPNLRLPNEDYLFTFILRLLQKEDNENVSKYGYLESIKFEYLSKTLFTEYFKLINYTEITANLWNQITNYLSLTYQDNPTSKTFSERYALPFEYDNAKDNAFNGIIRYLTNKYDGNLCKKQIIKFTYSSMYQPQSKDENIFNLDSNNYFQFNGKIDTQSGKSWFIYDFGENLKIRPTNYSIRSRNLKKGENHMQTWNIQVSNTTKDWIVIDERKNETCLDYPLAIQTFKCNKLNIAENQYFRYIRFLQTGPDTETEFYGYIAALEFFGSLISLPMQC